MSLSRSPSAKPMPTRREFLQETTAQVITALAAMTGGNTQEVRAQINRHSEQSARDSRPREICLQTGRRMEFRELGQRNGIPCIFIHGLLGSSNSFTGIEDMLRELNIHAVAPNLYGRRTEWWKRDSVADTGDDIAALSGEVHGPNSKPNILCFSASGKDGMAACATLNQEGPHRTVPNLYVVSAQMDLTRGDVFNVLSCGQQRDLNAILGRAKQAHLPLFQPLRNAGAGLKQRVAHRKISQLVQTQKIATQSIVGLLSPQDRAVLEVDEDFKAVLYEDASAYTYGEIIDSIRKLCHWNIDLSKLKGTNVKILHGMDDMLVHPRNARILERMLKQAGVENVQVFFFPEGHLLLKVRARQIGEMMVKDLQH